MNYADQFRIKTNNQVSLGKIEADYQGEYDSEEASTGTQKKLNPAVI